MRGSTAGVSFPPWLLEKIDENHMKLGYRHRSEFIQDAAKEKLQREASDIELPNE